MRSLQSRCRATDTEIYSASLRFIAETNVIVRRISPFNQIRDVVVDVNLPHAGMAEGVVEVV